MPSVWGWLSRRKQGREKSSRHQEPQQHGRRLVSSERVYKYGHADTEDYSSQAAVYRKQTNYNTRTEQQFVLAPEIGDGVRTGLGYEQSQLYLGQRDEITTKQNAAWGRPQPSNGTFEGSNLAARGVVHWSGPDPDILFGRQQHVTSVSDLRDPRLSPFESAYSHRVVDLDRRETHSRYGQGRPGVLQSLKAEPSFVHAVDKKQNLSHLDQKSAVLFPSARNNIDANFYMAAPPSAFYIPGRVALRQSAPDVPQSQDRQARRPGYGRGSGVISTFVPRIVGQRDLSAILLGNRDMQLNKSRPDYSMEDNSRHFRQSPEPISLVLSSVASKGKHHILPQQGLSDEKTSFPGKPYPGTRNKTNFFPEARTKLDQSDHGFSNATGRYILDSSNETFRSLPYFTSDDQVTGSDTASCGHQVNRSYRYPNVEATRDSTVTGNVNGRGDYSGDNGRGGYNGDNDRGDYSGDNSRGDYSGDNSRGGYSGDNSRGGYSGDNNRGGYSRDNSRGGDSGDNSRGGDSGDNSRGGYSGDNSRGGYSGDNNRGGYSGNNNRGGYSGDNNRGGYSGNNNRGGYSGNNNRGGYSGDNSRGGYSGDNNRGGYNSHIQKIGYEYNDYDDDITDQEVLNALSQLDKSTNPEPERNLQTELEAMFETEGEVFY